MTAVTIWIVASAGCVEAESPEGGAAEGAAPIAARYAQGLTILTQNPSDGLSGIYLEGTLGVRFDTIREIENHPEKGHLSFAKDGTALNIDVRFTDLKGRNLGTSMATHALPEKWKAAPPVFGPEDAADRPILFRMVRTAAQSIGQATLDPSVLPEQERIAQMGEYAPAEMPRPTPPALPTSGMQTITGDWGPGNFFQIFEVHRGHLFFGEHSSTRWYNCQSRVGCGGWFETCNHGDCAGSLPEISCSNVSPWHNLYYDNSNVPSCDWWGSAYSYCGIWGGGMGHNCNDDSTVQMHRVLCDYNDWNMCWDYWGCPANAPTYCGC